MGKQEIYTEFLDRNIKGTGECGGDGRIILKSMVTGINWN
jgi:hypothetical protein